MLAERDRFYRNVLKPDIHYGVIPGTKNPTLFKPGAEALLSAMALHAETGDECPPVVDVTGKDHDGEPFIQFVRWCRISRQTGPTMNDRIEIAKLTGSCNSWEPKYRYRDEQRACPTCGGPHIIKGKQEYGGGWICFKKKGGCGAKFSDSDPAIEKQTTGRIANPDILELQNTILKMADKRALIAATLVATGCSDIFTQDVEDMPATTRQAPAQNGGTPIAEATARADARNEAIQEAHQGVVDRKAEDEEGKRKRVRDSIMISCKEHGISDARRHAVSLALCGWESTANLTLPKLREVEDRDSKELAGAKITADDEDGFRLWLAYRVDLRNEVPM